MKRVIQKFFFDLFIRGWSVATCTNCAVITLINPLSSLSPSFLLGSSSIPPPSRRALLMPQKVSMKRKWVTLLSFAEDFTVNLRIPAALRSDPGHSARFSSLVQPPPRIVRKERMVGCHQGRIHYFPYRRIFSDDSCYSRAILSVDSQSRAYPTWPLLFDKSSK